MTGDPPPFGNTGIVIDPAIDPDAVHRTSGVGPIAVGMNRVVRAAVS
jgi:hypothetical protein